MALNKVKIGTFVEKYSEKCGIPNLTVNDISGINRDKEFFEPSKQVGADTSGYSVVPPNYFACNLMHVGRDVVLPISINHTEKNKIVSPAYTVFKITNEKIILKEYFFMCLKSNEKDRFFWFNTDSSVRDGMEWDVFCDVELTLPSIDVQKKYVAIYKALLHNLEAYQAKLDDLKLICDGYIGLLTKTIPRKKIGSYIHLIDVRNLELVYGMNAVRGISNTKEIMSTKATVKCDVIDKFYIIQPGEFIYNPRTTRMGDKVGLAYNNTKTPLLFSFNNIAFAINKNKMDEVTPDYLYLFFKRNEFDRFARVNSWGSATELFSFDDLCELKIPIPDIKVQKSIVKIHDALLKRSTIVETLKSKINEICPILINGSIKEGGTR